MLPENVVFRKSSFPHVINYYFLYGKTYVVVLYMYITTEKAKICQRDYILKYIINIVDIMRNFILVLKITTLVPGLFMIFGTPNYCKYV